MPRPLWFTLSVFAILSLQPWLVPAVCCDRDDGTLCTWGTRTQRVCDSQTILGHNGNYCCGVGPCNIFCCNCDYGCRTFDRCPDEPATGGHRKPPKRSDVLHDITNNNRTDADCTREKFALLDAMTTADGEITMEEWLKGAPELLSNTIGEDEFLLIQAFQKWDRDQSGSLSLEEAQQRY